MQDGNWSPALLRPTRTVAKVAQILLGLIAWVAAVFTAVLAQGFSFVDRFSTLSDAEISSWINTMDAVGNVQTLLTLAAAVAFLVWQYRTVANAPLLWAGVPRFGAGASVVWWFIPFANFVLPYVVIRELWRRLRLKMDGYGAPVGFWWLTYFAAQASSLAGGLLPITGLDSVRQLVVAGVVSEILGVIAAVLAILVVRRIQAAADERERRLATSG
jgi:hypothetical protein